jgi:apolipoprotein N-acyltransferase
LVLAAWVLEGLNRPVLPRRDLIWGSGIALALVAAAGVYGVLRMDAVQAAARGAPDVRIVAIQPNFSLKRLASNPALSPSDREQSLGALLRDSERALREGGPSQVPTVVVWPESVYPTAYFLNEPVRELVERWVRSRGIHLVLASVDVRRTPDTASGRSVYGISVHVPPDGGEPRVYRKIFLMPWGEYIPFGDWFPFYRRLLKAWIPQIGEFQAGTEHTVFPVSEDVRLAPMICYDATQVDIAQGMTANGANLALVLANLAWFGEGTASNQFEHVIRFRAIENRQPLLFISQNGRTLIFDANGDPGERILPAFQSGALVADLKLPNTRSLFTAYGGAVNVLFVLGAVGVWGLVWWRKRDRT